MMFPMQLCFNYIYLGAKHTQIWRIDARHCPELRIYLRGIETWYLQALQCLVSRASGSHAARRLPWDAGAGA